MIQFSNSQSRIVQELLLLALDLRRALSLIVEGVKVIGLVLVILALSPVIAMTLLIANQDDDYDGGNW